MLLQAIQNHPQTELLVQSSAEGVAEQLVEDQQDAQQDASSKASEQGDLPGITNTESFQAGVLSPARRLALMYRSQKKMLLWDVVLSLQK